MKRIPCASLLLPVLLAVSGAPIVAAGPELPRHELSIELRPAEHRMEVTDRWVLDAERAGQRVEFLLNEALTIRHSRPRVERIPLGDVSAFFGLNTGTESTSRAPLARYRLKKPAADGVVELTYGGVVDHGLGDQREEYTRGFRETSGIVGPDGVYLAGDGFWYPRPDDGLLTFSLEVALPEGWHVVSQGDGTSRDEQGRARWSADDPMEEIYLTGGPLRRWSEPAGDVTALVYLREPDDALAGKYLTTTARYVTMYRELIGPYPYSKFALVENFWETGYGMPSFTLLGPRVIRFPFILHSSYPHEILHNWWGNSVFVDYASGNWAEGLTAYLADHLVQEQRGRGEEHRRNTLQKYRNYVRDGRDFPLAEFRSRHSAATEAVGYGKTLMVFHMLRRQLGDEAFASALAVFYREHRGRRAAFDDLRTAFEGAGGEDLEPFFEQWVGRAGAPRLELAAHQVVEEDDGSWTVLGVLRQSQDGETYALDVPLRLDTVSGPVPATVHLDDREVPFVLRAEARPLSLVADPSFDLFRLLDAREIPSSIGQIFGAPSVLAVIPAAATETERAAYRALVEGWGTPTHEIEIRSDAEVERLPADRAVWLLGRDNRLAGELFVADGPPGLTVEGFPGATVVTLGGERASLEDRSLVAIRRHPHDENGAVGWLVVEPSAAFAGMARKLPHYGKYSYLVFEGDEPTNVIKGQWTTAGSPLSVDLRPPAERATPLPPAPGERRRALAELPPVFSKGRLAGHVAALAAPEMEGRGIGTVGLARAAEYVARRFEEIGLLPGGDDGTYFQRFTVPEGPDGRPHETANVIGVLPGSRRAWDGQSAIVSAHHDHLGRGWPDVHRGDEGRLHPGADDNASGVAVLIELARSLASDEAPGRAIVFAAFSAEEAGKLGSRHYAGNPGRYGLEGLIGVVNLDTVGRLGQGKVRVHGTGTADEWQHIFRGSGFVTGVDSVNVPGAAEGSDQQSFIERGVPAVQIFTGAHEDYHRPGDTPDKVDAEGLVRVATFVKEAVAYLGGREEPMSVTIDGAAASTARPSRPSGRRVRFGTIPDFAHAGPGARIDSVLPGSPAAAAGLAAGDVIVRIDDHAVADLRGYSGVLRLLEPGQTVQVEIRRGESTLVVPVTVEAR